MIHIGIMGATGYTGLELAKLLARHPAARIEWLTSENSAGQTFGDVFANSLPYGNMPLVPAAEADLSAVDMVFCCLPHKVAQAPVAAARAAGARVIDLSADFRLHDVAQYQRWYNTPHTQLALLAEAVYGLPELHRAQIAAAHVVANPGCYPTSVILGLAPLARRGWLSGAVIADSKSGVSGAGRSLSLKSHFVEVNENLSPYSIGRSHRHLAEMEQELQALAAGSSAAPAWTVIFSPHLVPLNRGIVSTLYANLPAGTGLGEVQALYREMYAGEPFLRLLPPTHLATVGHTAGTNYCAIGLTFVPETGTLIVTSSIDNLIKGASGQALQCMNIMCGIDETTALL